MLGGEDLGQGEVIVLEMVGPRIKQQFHLPMLDLKTESESADVVKRHYPNAMVQEIVPLHESNTFTNESRKPSWIALCTVST